MGVDERIVKVLSNSQIISEVSVSEEELYFLSALCDALGFISLVKPETASSSLLLCHPLSTQMIAGVRTVGVRWKVQEVVLGHQGQRLKRDGDRQEAGRQKTGRIIKRTGKRHFELCLGSTQDHSLHSKTPM